MTNSSHVEVHVAANGNYMRNAAGFELTDLDIAHFDRVVDQLGVILCRKSTEPVLLGLYNLHGGRDTPFAISRAGRRPDFKLAHMVFLSDYRGKNTGPIEESVGRIKMSAPDVEVIGMNLGSQRNGCIAGVRLPAALVDFRQADLLPVRVRPNRNKVPRKIPNHVAARHPGGDRENLARRVRPGNGHCYFK